MKIKEITSSIESFAPLALQESYDNSGLLAGDPEAEVRQALVCIDSTEEVVEEAIRKKCQLIIAHHPIIFSGLKKLNGKNYVERAVIRALKNNIAIYAAHTNLDNVHEGVNRMICDKLGLSRCSVLAPKTKLLRKLVTFCPLDKADKVRQAVFAAGAGHIGNYNECSFNADGFGTFRGGEGTDPYVGERGKQHHEKELRIETIYPAYIEPRVLQALFENHPYEEVAYDIYPLENRHGRQGSGMTGELKKEIGEQEFLRKLKAVMKAPVVRHTKPLGRKVKKVAVCGGSGSFLLGDAIAAGANVFVTADLKYHQFFDADGRILLADIGHYESEQYTKDLFLNLLKKNFPTFAVLLSELNTNPVNYL